MLPELDQTQLPPGCKVYVVPEKAERKPQSLFADLPEVVSAQSAAKAIGCCDRQIRKMLSEGTLSGFKVGTSWRVTKAALIAFIEGGGCRG